MKCTSAAFSRSPPLVTRTKAKKLAPSFSFLFKFLAASRTCSGQTETVEDLEEPNCFGARRNSGARLSDNVLVVPIQVESRMEHRVIRQFGRSIF